MVHRITRSHDWTDSMHAWYSVQFSSVSQSCQTLCDPMDCSTPGLPVHHQLLEFTQTHVHRVGDVIQPSHPLLSPSPPAFTLVQHQGLFKWDWWEEISPSLKERHWRAETLSDEDRRSSSVTSIADGPLLALAAKADSSREGWTPLCLEVLLKHRGGQSFSLHQRQYCWQCFSLRRQQRPQEETQQGFLVHFD